MSFLVSIMMKFVVWSVDRANLWLELPTMWNGSFWKILNWRWTCKVGPLLVMDMNVEVVAIFKFSRRLKLGRPFWFTGRAILDFILDKSLKDKMSIALEGLLLVLKTAS